VKVKRFFGKNKVPVHHVVNLYPDESDFKSFTVIRHLLRKTANLLFLSRAAG
jgi:hypothetical protein